MDIQLERILHNILKIISRSLRTFSTKKCFREVIRKFYHARIGFVKYNVAYRN